MRARLFLAGAFCTLFVWLSGAVRADDDAVFQKPVPENADDLQAIQTRVTALVQKVIPCTVALQVGRAQASGVIVSADGYVLTAAHVIERPGRDVTVILSDGRGVQGKTLGLNPQVDGGLIKITDPGPWQFAPIAPRGESPHPGEWCIATGHPGGYQSGRAPPVRLGRVIDSDRSVIRTDCIITMGDSGGPLFDIEGRVIGIHSRIADETTMNLHVPAATYQEAWDVLQAGEVARQPSRFLARFDSNGDGKISRDEVPEAYRAIFDRMVTKLELDPNQSYAIEELSKSLGLDGPRGFDSRQLLLPMRMLRPGESLPSERFAHSPAVRSAFSEIVRKVRSSIVRVRCNGSDVAIGTVIDQDGWIATKASELSAMDSILCVFADGHEAAARCIGTDAATDLAFLRISENHLSPVQFQPEMLQPGMWLASAGPADKPLAIGVVSVGERTIAGTPGMLGITIDDTNAGPVVTEVMPSSGAAEAGIRVGDLVTRIEKDRVRSRLELQTIVRRHRVGEVIAATIIRDGSELEFSVRLRSLEESFAQPQPSGRGRGQGQSAQTWRGRLSQRRDDFPAAVQHDTVLRTNECGGPVLDVQGNAVGINIARADRTATYALPGSAVLALFEKFRSANRPSSDE